MNFVSKDFLIFFTIFSALYFLTKNNLKVQNVIILIASLFFYGWWDYRFLGLMLFTAGIDYFSSLLIVKHPQNKKSFLAISIFLNLFILSLFKYYNFFIDSANYVLGSNWSNLNVILPIGISFYTFQSMSYVIDVYREKMKPIKNINDFFLCISFFPHLVAGPIIRADYLYPQIANKRNNTLGVFYSGVPLIFWGFFKKMVIADNAAIIVDTIFHSNSTGAIDVLLGTIAFTIQIYGDFSGYSDIARGISRSIGIEIPENFHLPYFAQNPSDFWQRWHISLSSWLRDYLYIPLGGNKISHFRTYINLFITMVLGGLWHGASWTFIIWGAYHGVLLIVYKLVDFKNDKKGFSKVIAILIYLIFTSFGWLIFRAESVNQLKDYLKALCFNWEIETQISTIELTKFGLISLFLALVQFYQYFKNDLEPWFKWKSWLRVVWIVTLFYGIILFGIFNVRSFIYFQF